MFTPSPKSGLAQRCPSSQLFPRKHLAQSAGWCGWCCPQYWRLGRCRSQSCLAPPAESTASRSAPRVGIEGAKPLEQASDHALPRLASRGGSTPGSGYRDKAPPQAFASCPSAPLPGLHQLLILYLVHPAQQHASPASGPGPGQGPVLGASKSHEAGGCHGPHNARSRAPVPELPAPGEVSPGTEGVL